MEAMTMRTRTFSPDEERVGQRIRYYRKLRGMSLRTLAGLAGMDYGYLGRIERGDVSGDNRHYLSRIAEALGRPMTDLTGVPTHGGPDGALLVANVQKAVRAFVDADLDFDGDPALLRPLDQLDQAVTAAVRLRVACEYSDLTRMLPGLIGSLHAAATVGAGEERQQALTLFVRAAEAGSMGVKFTGDTGSAAMIAERCWQAAQLAADPESMALAAWTRAHAALGCGLNQRAWQLAERGADRLRPLAESALPLLGMLHLTSAFAQASMGRYGSALAPLGEAEELAGRTGETKDHGLFFGPTNVTFWRVPINLDGGEPDDAIRIGNTVRPGLIPSASRQATFYADLGRALARVGQDEAAVRQLRAARRIAPQRIDSDPILAETVRGLVDSAQRRAVGADLRNLAERMQVAA
jgi:transcriptional regulator with XRE-family HTH domain